MSCERPFLLGELQRRLPGSRLLGRAEIRVSDVSSDARTTRPGALFFAIPSQAASGPRFVPDAVANGAVAIVSGSELERFPGVPVLRVDDVAQAKARAAALLYGDPAERLQVVGVTGTDGKTTTSLMLRSVLTESGLRSGWIGSLGIDPGSGLRPHAALMTTPGPIALQRSFAEMVEQGCRAVVMEVSSHALDQRRADGVPFRAAVFTHLSSDHLDYHRTRAAYLDAKARLFEMLPGEAVAVLNGDDPTSEELARRTRAPVVRYGLGSGHDVTARIDRLTFEGAEFRLISRWGSADLATQLIGRHNVANALAASAAALALGAPLEAIDRGLRALRVVPGRLEAIDRGQPFRVLVDYANTEHALRSVLEAVRPLTPERLILVFGCYGDRDRSKRPRMGSVASRLADTVFVTSTSPGPEDPDAIIAAVMRGVDGAAEVRAISDRREAIRAALHEARAGDLVLLAGQGHETFQTVGPRRIPLDDRALAAEILESQGAA